MNYSFQSRKKLFQRKLNTTIVLLLSTSQYIHSAHVTALRHSATRIPTHIQKRGINSSSLPSIIPVLCIASYLPFLGAVAAHSLSNTKSPQELVQHILNNAAKNGNLEHVVKLSQRSELDFEEPLYLAAQWGQVTIFEYLIKRAALTPEQATLLFAKATGNLDSQAIEAVRILLKQNPSLAGTPIAHETLDRATCCGNAAWVELLLQSGTPANIPDKYPLHQAVKSHNTEIIAMLLNHGAKPDTEDNDGLTPLQHAVKHPKGYMIVKKLINAGACTDKYDRLGSHLIEWAVTHADKKTAKLLADKTINAYLELE